MNLSKQLTRNITKLEIVHHIDGNKKNNKKNNLNIQTRSSHSNIHNKKLGKNVCCDNCNKIIYRSPYSLNKFKHNFCSRSCYFYHRWGSKNNMPPVGKNPRMARNGAKNGRWKKGKSSDYRRNLMDAKPGELVHHKDHNKGNNTKSNFQVIKPGNGISAIGKHNRSHPEKGRKKK